MKWHNGCDTRRKRRAVPFEIIGKVWISVFGPLSHCSCSLFICGFPLDWSTREEHQQLWCPSAWKFLEELAKRRGRRSTMIFDERWNGRETKSKRLERCCFYLVSREMLEVSIYTQTIGCNIQNHFELLQNLCVWQVREWRFRAFWMKLRLL